MEFSSAAFGCSAVVLSRCFFFHSSGPPKIFNSFMQQGKSKAEINQPSILKPFFLCKNFIQFHTTRAFQKSGNAAWRIVMASKRGMEKKFVGVCWLVCHQNLARPNDAILQITLDTRFVMFFFLISALTSSWREPSPAGLRLSSTALSHSSQLPLKDRGIQAVKKLST